MSEHLYYIRKDTTELGPLTLSQLRSMWCRGEVTIRTPYRLEGWKGWKNLDVMQPILDGAEPPPPAHPTPKKKAEFQKGCGCAGLIGIVFLFIMLSGSKDNQGLAPDSKDNGPEAMPAEEAERLNKLYPSTGIEEIVRAEPIKEALKKQDGEELLKAKLSESIKKHIPTPDSFQFEKQTSFMDLGDFNQSIVKFTAENEFGHRKEYEARSHVSLNGDTVAVVEIQDEDSGLTIFEDGVAGVKIKLVKARASTWTRDDGEEFIMVYLDWKNIGEKPIHAVKATIRSKDEDGQIMDFLSVLSPYYIYVSEDAKGILPGETYTEPKGRGYNLGKVETLKKFRFKTADARLEKAYGQRGLEGKPN
ncbi:DUF4339 domain-containing protein [Prosthecobacter dejongeii]|uniref:GYF domain-containing protein n=1 Tax=Prosthecobacter dejongeii TaxID=48465 RepID=A0A7W7YM79_9BACT|nr:DUF4339 domain-containing protein [Prosthecobacter dejongeii]MBB5038639.1 hypothetical protein [Prosthecobacter dejongeii]